MPEDQRSVSFAHLGDNATINVGGAHNAVGGHGPGPAGRWRTRGAFVVGLATVIGTGVAVATVLMAPEDGMGADPATTPTTVSAGKAPVVSGETGTDPAAAAPDEPPLIFSDAVDLAGDTGLELDNGRAEVRYRQDASTDLYINTSAGLWSSVRHSAIYDDTGQGTERGAYQRCRTHVEAERDSSPKETIVAGFQFCFTTSAGHPGWVQIVSPAESYGYLIKVNVWQS